MSDIDLDAVRKAILGSTEAESAVAVVLRDIARQAVMELSFVLGVNGVDPAALPGEYLLQAVLCEAQRVFKAISREGWIGIFDAYTDVKAVIDGNPGLREEAVAHFSRDKDGPSPLEKLMSGEF